MSFKETLKMLVLVLCGFLAAIHDVSAGFLYLIVIYVGYKVLVSLCLHHWKEKGKLITESEENTEIFYIRGAVVREEIKSLQNVCTTSEERLERVYKTLLSMKLILVSLFVYFVLYQDYLAFQAISLRINTLSIIEYIGIVGVVVITIYILMGFIKTISFLSLVNQRRWYVHRHLDGQTTYFSAYQQHNEEYKSLLLQIM